ncbi:hypothetical protein EG240_10750 [Paenimyroides tangerinum]|uniref:Uncharacterized protein n=1 Tax=Paenimyroides tangerinum TaxID=2488728 RepID=A0A3P3WAL6_9FLAO|nr:hypothetical protein [Paenimyroides tangerinum]RRJ89673.1 hypothetical protein EG240_10750 [Paenimyroides tangerinum]
MDEKNVKKLSLKLYKLQLDLAALNDEKLKGIIKEIESIDKELLKENNVKFPSKMKNEILDFM